MLNRPADCVSLGRVYYKKQIGLFLKHKISVITVNYNSSQYTKACVDSILKHTSSRLDYQIVVVDNNSEPDDYRKLMDLSGIDKVLVVRSKINLGFAGGNMYGVQFCDADYYFFLNNDSELQNDCLSILSEFCEQKPEVGICSPQLYEGDGRILCSFDYFPSLASKLLGTGLLRLMNPRQFPKKRFVYTEPLQVDIVSGSTLFVRATAFNELGGFDTNLFLYCEEEDIALRMRQHHYAVYLVPAAHNIHHAGASTQKSLAIRKEFYISFLYIYTKHYGFLKTQILKLLLIIRLLRKSIGSAENLELAVFIARNAPMKCSLKHKQTLRDL